MKIVTVIGARPQFIKAAALSRVLRAKHQEILVHTGQHYDKNMSEVFFEELHIPKADYNLGVGSASHAVQTANIMVKLEPILLEEKPDLLLIYGDTNSTLAAAIVAAKLLIPIAHVEAGPRTLMFEQPEEQNRIVTDHLSTLLFAPTKISYQNLVKEGLEAKSYDVGDVMFDALLYYSKLAEQQSFSYYFERLKFLGNEIKDSELSNGWYLSTIHRPQNTDVFVNLRNVLEALNVLEKIVIFPVHPRTQKMISKIYKDYPNICFVEPLSYLDTIFFCKNAKKIITDSGGLHKEAYLHGIRCVTVLNNGWPETTQDRWNIFVEPKKDSIIEAIYDNHESLDKNRSEFGDGHASEKICQILEQNIKCEERRL